jgi:alpha-1,6-mannosyltransferase
LTPLLLLGMNGQNFPTFVPVLLYILAISLLPHKELRFIIYAFPVLNSAVTCGFIKLSSMLNKTLKTLFILTLMAGTAFYYYIAFQANSYNYYGGTALSKVHQMNISNGNVSDLSSQ